MNRLKKIFDWVFSAACILCLFYIIKTVIVAVAAGAKNDDGKK
jgi:lipopolysaccharide/colanic/teichoic acid biosynthesis glycosyltransferase